ncbi:DUF2007 domain-containing protein [Cryomorphaceae bacterium 1068]|nr:DUF2007 domain-containing protein [Cryomorphaceae bacterium 1068]
MENNKLVKLLTGSSIEVSRIAALLEDNSIAIFTKDNVESARVAGFGVPQNSVELHVAADDFDRAKKILEEAKKASRN